MSSKPRVVFLHGRPGPHPFHAAMARSVGAEFLPVDFVLRWHDQFASRPRRYLSWLLCALLFPRRGQYDIFLAEGPHFLPGIMRRLGLLRRDQRTVCLLDNEALYFMKSGYYPTATHWANLQALRAYDGLMCVGRMQTALARDIVSGFPSRPAVLTIPSAIPSERWASLAEVTPSLDEKQLLFVGNGPSGWRGWYKGLDLLLEAVRLAAPTVPGVRLQLVGSWDHTYVESLLGRPLSSTPEVTLLGQVSDVSLAASRSALYVHLGRGEAFGISVLEAMRAGVPALVSEWTGAREAAEQVDPRLVVPLDAQTAAERICWYLDLPLEEKRRLSARARGIAAEYTEERALQEFATTLRRFAGDVDIPNIESIPC